MDISEIISPVSVLANLKPSSKKQVLQELAEVGARETGIECHTIFETLLEREKLGSTGVGNGVALPHARLAAASRVCGTFVLLEKPVDFGAADRQPVDIVFSLFAPENAGVEHLKALALVSRTLRDNGICSKLRANTDPGTLYTILTEAYRTQAA